MSFILHIVFSNMQARENAKICGLVDDVGILLPPSAKASSLQSRDSTSTLMPN